MKDVHVCLAAFLGIVCDYVAGQSTTFIEVNACYDTFYGKGVCIDRVSLLACLKKITPNEDVWELEAAISYNKKQLEICPGFKTGEKCHASEILKCKASFYSKQTRGDKSVCNELQQVRDCLVKKLNDSCIKELVRDEIMEVDDLDKDCKSGNFTGEPCGGHSVMACAAPVYRHYRIGEDGVGGYQCNSEDVAKSMKCLSDLETTCKTGSTQVFLAGHEREELKRSCPSP